MMFVEKLAMDMLEKEHPESQVMFNGSRSPDFTIIDPDGGEEYVEVKSLGRKDGNLELKCRQIDKIRRLVNASLWVFDCHDKLICKVPMNSVVPNKTMEIVGVRTVKIRWHGQIEGRRKAC